MGKKIILSLDGGGVKGLYQSVILDALKEKGIVFDLIVGVSVGALNGIVYNQGTFTLKEAMSLEDLRKCCDKSILDRLVGALQPFPIYDGKGKTENVRKYLTTTTFGDFKTPMAVLTYDIGMRYPKVFKTWEDKEDSTVDIASATTAAPIYYPAHEYKGHWYVDGGISMNNPALLAYGLAKDLYPEDEIFILSIGTGDCPDVDLSGKHPDKWGLFEWIKNGLLSLITNTPSQYTDEVCQSLLKEKYMRIEDDSIGEIEIDDTEKSTYQRILSAGENAINLHLEKILTFLKV